MDTLALLLGRWRVERRVLDHRTGDETVFAGTAVVEEARSGSAPGATYVEDGELSRGEHRSPAGRRLTYHPRPDGALDVRFADGRRFVDLDLRSGAWEAHHPCAPDSYLVETEVVSPTSFVERWTVRGPAKSYDATTTYTRTP
ncbi:DUF6314 family protein [Frigoribacterium faeni]|uniref:DUF6314 domain-containing protein n=1 Tax=Frigoribacterium faeni TaxID=145483 RepID=A0A7W3PIT9_9MICO|nr:DUF6314 family protein [Frigoribacterium faeni]MBA8813735.1 hypothetical protein [Frigoribacterium faeni]GEK83382.1 hypothetical protein FFA01_16910 [Frigoribacterium faeni]